MSTLFRNFNEKLNHEMNGYAQMNENICVFQHAFYGNDQELDYVPFGF